MKHQFVRDLMTKNVITLNLTDSVMKARKLMKDNEIESVLVHPARGGSSWWIFTKTDLLIALESGDNPENIQIGDYASLVKYKAKPDWEYQKVLEEMNSAGVKHLPVFDNENRLVGIISSNDLIDNY